MIIKEDTIRSERIYEGKIINLRVDQVTSREGVSSREIVEHRGAVAVLPITDKGDIVFVKQYRKPAEKILLEIPAGKVEEGENNMKEVALRELKEETGYDAKEIGFLTSYYPSVGFSTEVIHLFWAKGLRAGETDLDPGESIETYTYTRDQARQMIADGTIEDGKTIIAFLMLDSQLVSL